MANTKKKTTPVAAKKDNTVEIPVVAEMTKAEPKKEAKVEAKKEAEVKKAEPKKVEKAVEVKTVAKKEDKAPAKAATKVAEQKPAARIFYRNSINIGLPIIECPEAAEAIQAGDEVEIDFDTGIITDKTQNRQFKGQAFPPFMQKIIAAGGLINYINED